MRVSDSVRKLAPYGPLALCAIVGAGMAAPVLAVFGAAAAGSVAKGAASVGLNLLATHSHSGWSRYCRKLVGEIEISNQPLIDAMNKAFQNAIDAVEDDVSPGKRTWFGRNRPSADARARSFYDALRAESRKAFAHTISTENKTSLLMELDQGETNAWNIVDAFIDSAFDASNTDGNESRYLTTIVRGLLPGFLASEFNRLIWSSDSAGTAAWRELQTDMFSSVLRELRELNRITQQQHAEVMDVLHESIRENSQIVEEKWSERTLEFLAAIEDSIARVPEVTAERLNEIVDSIIGSQVSPLLAQMLEAQREISGEFNRVNLGKARIVSNRELQWGTSGPNVDILVPEFDRALEQHLPIKDEALARLAEYKAIFIIGKPLSGKSHLAGWLLENIESHMFVVIPKSYESPPSFDSLRGQPVALFLDNFHERANSFDPTPWWEALSSVSGDRCYLIVSSRAGDYWDRVEENQNTFLERIDTGAFLRIEDMPADLAREVARNLGDESSLIEQSWDGTIGSLRVDMPKMGREYKRLMNDSRGGVFASRLMNAAKILHNLRQVDLHHDLLFDVSKHILGDGQLSNEQWSWLQHRTGEQGFGRFDEAGMFQTYAPYLENPEIITFSPDEQVLPAFDLILKTSNPAAIFHAGLAVEEDLGKPVLAEQAYALCLDLGWGSAARALGRLYEDREDPDRAEEIYRRGLDLQHFPTGHALAKLLRGQQRTNDLEDLYSLMVGMGDSVAVLRLGKLYENQNRFDEAEQLYRQGTSDSDHPVALRLGVLLEQQQRYSEAEELYRSRTTLGDIPAVIRLGAMLERRNQLGDAESVYRQMLHSKDGSVAHKLVLLLEEQGRTDEAIEVYWQRIELLDGPSILRFGELLEAQERLEEAEQLYRSRVNLNDTVAVYGLVPLLQQQNRIDEAEKIYWQRLAMKDGSVPLRLGSLLEKQNRLDEAESVYRVGLEMGYSYAAVPLGKLLERLNRLPEAEGAYRKGLALGDNWSSHSLGQMLERQGRLKDAEDAYKQDPDSGSAMFLLGLLLRTQNRPKEAGEAFERALSLGYGSAAVPLGEFFEGEGRDDDAKTAYERGLELENGWAALPLGRLLERQDRQADAQQAYERGLELKNSWVAGPLGKLLESHGLFDEAEKTYMQGIALENGIQAVIPLGRLLRQLGRFDDAEEAYESAVQFGYGKAAYQLGRLLEQQGRHKDAEHAYQRGLELGNDWVAVPLGKLLLSRNEIQDAAKVFRQGEQLGNGRAAYELGRLLEMKLRFDDSEIAYRRGIELGNDRSASQLGSLLERRGRPKEAEEAYRRGIELGSDRSAFRLGRLLEKQHRIHEARLAYKKGADLGDRWSATRLRELAEPPFT